MEKTLETITEKRKAGRPRKITQEVIDKLLQLHDNGWGYITIKTELRAQGYRVSREQIRYYVRKYRGPYLKHKDGYIHDKGNKE